jgi:hypothetical protein
LSGDVERVVFGRDRCLMLRKDGDDVFQVWMGRGSGWGNSLRPVKMELITFVVEAEEKRIVGFGRSKSTEFVA